MEQVFLVDDDAGVRRSLARVLNDEGFSVEQFDSAEAFLARAEPPLEGCIVLDVTMPGLDGLELQRRLTGAGWSLPIVFVSGHGDIPMSVRAMKAGAVDFLTKPFREADLMGAINAALTRSREARRTRAELADLHQRLSLLTPREREVLTLVASGLLNKQAAAELGISEVTLQIHRGNIMKKMEADSLAELVRMAGTLDIAPARSRHPSK